jgi:alpha-tubulin suppressor-like RCC1 family protein
MGLESGVSSLVAGGYHTCAMTTSGTVRCWGWNWAGQLGDGTTVNHGATVDVALPAGSLASLSAGGHHTCAVRIDGGALCWGSNFNGQLGDGTNQSSSLPVPVIGLESRMISLAAGMEHTCALRIDGEVLCWGDNVDGQLGNGNLTDSLRPAVVNGLSEFTDTLASGTNHTCASMNGRLKCWGRDTDGQLGVGSAQNRLAPVEVLAGGPQLQLNYSSGAPGSRFTLTGEHAPNGSPVSLSVNGTVLTTTLAVSETGSFIIFLDTAEADPGFYEIRVGAHPASQAAVVLYPGGVQRGWEGNGNTLSIGAGLAAFAHQYYIPLVER